MQQPVHLAEMQDVDRQRVQFSVVPVDDVPGKGEAVELVETEKSVHDEIERLEKSGKWEEGVSLPLLTEDGKPISDFPIVINRQVEAYLDIFQNSTSERFREWLARSSKYIPMIREELQQAGLPLDLAYLPLIESGYSEIAYSRAKAVGMWQFMKPTAERYGLRVNSNIDERRDPVKATRAAIRYLTDLYDEFQSWYLAVAAYNAGEGRIRGAIRKSASRNFWELAQDPYLHTETKRYVPKLIAAILIAKSPEKHGFADIAYREPVQYDVIEVAGGTGLKAVALAGGIDEESIRELNREIRGQMVPPGDSSYLLKVPVGKKPAVLANLSRIRSTVETHYRSHVVTRKDSLDKICDRYDVAKSVLLKTNNLKKSKLRAGQRLRIPYQTVAYELADVSRPETKTAAVAAPSAESMFVMHRVRPGDSVSKIASMFKVSSKDVLAWNNMGNSSRLKAGDKLLLYVPPGTPPVSPIELAGKSTDESPLQAISASEKKKNAAVAEKTSLSVITEDGKKKTVTAVHRVKRGETLSAIANRYNVSTDKLRSINKIRGNKLKAGELLQVRLTAGKKS